MNALFARGSALLLVAVLLSGCSWVQRHAFAKRQAAMQRAAAAARERPTLVGQIALVNADDGFVLIDGATTQTPSAGVTLRSYSAGAVSGELRATGVRRRPFFIADIARGTPAKGDIVLLPAIAESATPPRPLPVSKSHR